jgi:hypothetical protein
LEGYGHNLKQILFRRLAEGHKAFHKRSVNKVGVPKEIPTRNMPNKKQKFYSYTSLLDKSVVK